MHATCVERCWGSRSFGLKNKDEATQGVLVLTDSKLSSDRLEGELAQFTRALVDFSSMRAFSLPCFSA